MPVALYGCKTLSLSLREERSPQVFKKRVLRRIFGPRRDEVTVEWRKLHNDEHYDLHPSDFIRMIKLRRMRWAYGGEERCTQGFGWET